jgi:hypothetical protein
LGRFELDILFRHEGFELFYQDIIYDEETGILHIPEEMALLVLGPKGPTMPFLRKTGNKMRKILDRVTARIRVRSVDFF